MMINFSYFQVILVRRSLLVISFLKFCEILEFYFFCMLFQIASSPNLKYNSFQSMSEDAQSRRKSYKQIPQEVRQQIINSILIQGQNIKEVSNRIGVNISTCKAIIKVYQQEGRIGKKKNRNKVHTVIQTFSFFTINNSQIQQIGGIQIDQSKISLDRNQDFDQHLQAKSKVKSQQILDKMIEEKRKFDQSAIQAQRILMECYMMQTCWLSNLSTMPQQNSQEIIKQEASQERQNAWVNNSSSQFQDKVRSQ